MKKLILLLTILYTTAFAQSLNWVNTNLDKALETAKKENKILMVYIEAEHCPWCIKMRTTTLSDKDVVRNLNKDYILYKLDANSADGKKYFSNIAITPTTLFVTDNKEVLEQIDGYLDTEFFFWSMAKAENKFKELKSK